MPPESKPDAPKDGSSRGRLPFEPARNRKPSEKKAEKAPAASTLTRKETPKKETGSPSSLSASAIPDVVSRRMVRRMALLCGVPSALGISTFFVSYLLVTKDLVHLPNAAVVLLSMGFFGLGVVGLSYGMISASWDEEIPGSVLGWSEFITNLGRMTAAWRSTGKKS